MTSRLPDRDALEQAQEQLPGRSVGDNLRLGGGIAVVIAALVFLLQNTEDAEVTFLFWDWTMPLFFALLSAALLGGLATWLFTTFRGRAARRRQEEMYEAAIRGARK